MAPSIAVWQQGFYLSQITCNDNFKPLCTPTDFSKAHLPVQCIVLYLLHVPAHPFFDLDAKTNLESISNHVFTKGVGYVI
jgi:hypothetical protein